MGLVMQRLQREYAKNNRGYYTFLCDCGQKIILRGDSTTKACELENCDQSMVRKHGKSHTRLYGIWSGMRDRCIGTHHSAKHYKDCGITICDTWSEFVVFERWAMRNGYTDSLTIDRINIDGDYEPSNCEWVTRSVNTLRQLADRHPLARKVTLDGTKEFDSISSAARYISQFTATKWKSITVTLESRLKQNSIKPYKGFVIRIV